ncbi:hypothetical protein BGZ82_006731 [Podila clonocystis]|nr:hypothetical protein BGZ82_006731 [Podila clonocystis]
MTLISKFSRLGARPDDLVHAWVVLPIAVEDQFRDNVEVQRGRVHSLQATEMIQPETPQFGEVTKRPENLIKW